MADLEAAADAALMKVKELEGGVEGGRAALTSLREELARLAARLDEDWAALREKGAAIVSRVQEESSRLAEDGREAQVALSELDGAMAATRAESERALAEAAAGVSALGAQVDGARPAMEALVQQAEAAFQSLSEQAAQVQAALEGALGSAAEFLESEVAPALEAMAEEIEGAAEEAAAVLGDELPSSLDELLGQWESKVAELESFIEEFFDDAATHAEGGSTTRWRSPPPGRKRPSIRPRRRWPTSWSPRWSTCRRRRPTSAVGSTPVPRRRRARWRRPAARWRRPTRPSSP
jgi:chromosome segregation ATPase